MGKATIKYLAVKKADIAYLQFLFEGYEGMGTVTTLDPERGLVSIFIPSALLDEAEETLRAIGTEIPLEEAPSGAGSNPGKRTV